MRALRFWAGLVLALLMMLASVLGPATRTQLFESALHATVNREAIGVTEADVSAFAQETMRYLRGEKAVWEPQISLYGIPAEASISQAFRRHMAQVRGWVQASPWVFAAGFALAALLLWFSRGAGRRPFLWGIYAAAGLVLALLLWAVMDFNSLWLMIHRWFIPDGIFAAAEPVMQLFPLGLFFWYMQPVVAALVLHFAVLVGGGMVLLARF